MQVVAIEPTPSLASALRRAAVGIPNYRVVEAAIGETDGLAKLIVYDAGQINTINSLYPSVPKEPLASIARGVRMR